MELDLRGKVALVTGSSQGIGRQIAAALAGEACQVLLNGRDPSRLEATAHAIGGIGVAGDVTTAAGAASVVERAVAVHGQLDLLVCNVGSGTSVPPGTESEEEWLRVLQLNLLATTNTVHAARRFLKKGAAIVCVSSICGSAELGAPTAYSASKAAVDSFVRSAARYLAKEGVRINAVAPGNILFEGGSWERKVKAAPEKVTEMLERDVALARFGTPEEVADMVLFLCSARTSFATGAVFVLDGGQLRS
ncbi:NAD(P)-dependent oxidoreductase [Herbaspirillum sp. BH-1]|jgi:3-oxoacyl-[acyl-carrier protein] reductase|uniref:3-oxoacyl-[acyl-carrier protein] reductase n=1 Tax=Herbaspirillum frisingense TaxID=92645 RepID=A0ABU1PF04_9BURK|nr:MULTISPECIES: SDR family NAD(P)-dependent oxidoreductase [Herbaspirillum]MDR6584355.1 3-oxoacyl-[acyl-carrier protein] reductase [Herbaspirillum frisingense]PLY59599.1 NAD(P)-dependent oxidoreductase [Herbaspirillum sp. BH-1]